MKIDWNECCGSSGPNTLPSPTASHGTVRGSGAHGPWLEVRTSSAIVGGAPGPRSRRSNAENRYWSGIGDQLKRGPRYPRSSWV